MKKTVTKIRRKNMQISLGTLKSCILLFFRACSTGLSGMLVSGNVSFKLNGLYQPCYMDESISSLRISGISIWKTFYQGEFMPCEFNSDGMQYSQDDARTSVYRPLQITLQ